jgi:hypothetical protein
MPCTACTWSGNPDIVDDAGVSEWKRCMGRSLGSDARFFFPGAGAGGGVREGGRSSSAFVLDIGATSGNCVNVAEFMCGTDSAERERLLLVLFREDTAVAVGVLSAAAGIVIGLSIVRFVWGFLQSLAVETSTGFL